MNRRVLIRVPSTVTSQNESISKLPQSTHVVIREIGDGAWLSCIAIMSLTQYFIGCSHCLARLLQRLDILTPVVQRTSLIEALL